MPVYAYTIAKGGVRCGVPTVSDPHFAIPWIDSSVGHHVSRMPLSLRLVRASTLFAQTPPRRSRTSLQPIPLYPQGPGRRHVSTKTLKNDHTFGDFTTFRIHFSIGCKSLSDLRSSGKPQDSCKISSKNLSARYHIIGGVRTPR